ncbi:hypothetical protein Tco_1435964 [Tanacetum coccineum]
MTRNVLITTWDWFEEIVKNCFGPSKYEDPQGALSKLLLFGLKLHLQRELLVSRPATLGDAFALARITEARLEDQTAPATGAMTKLVTSIGTQRQAVTRLVWERGHKCPGKFLLLMTDEEDDPRAETVEEGDDAAESGDILILNSLIGHRSPRSLQFGEKSARRMFMCSLT